MQRLLVISGGGTYELHVRPVPGASDLFRVAVRRPDGTEVLHEMRVLSRTSERWTVALEGDRILDVVVSRLADSLLVNWKGRTYRVRVAKKGAIGSAGPDQEHSGIVRSEMAGKVVVVLKRSGDAVEAGEALAILEAMKMQNSIKAPSKGRITKSAISEGQVVSAGQVLFELEPTEG